MHSREHGRGWNYGNTRVKQTGKQMIQALRNARCPVDFSLSIGTVNVVIFAGGKLSQKCW